MKKIIACGVAVAAIALIFACKKTQGFKIELEKVPAPDPVYTNYSQLKIGNYWVYRPYTVWPDGTETNQVQYDSCYISKDTLIRGHTYFKMNRPKAIFTTDRVSFLRDSLHYIINSDGAILFSSEDFSTVFEDTIVMYTPSDTLYHITRKMNDKDLVINVPAGQFKTSSMQSTYVMYKFKNPTANNPRYRHARYAKNMGLVLETDYLYSAVPYVIERRLVRYHLN